jgi:hypothetical protein
MPKTKGQPKTRTGSSAAAVAAFPDPTCEEKRTATKIDVLVALLRRPQGARIDELMMATGWQSHSVRGALSGAIKKELGLFVLSEQTRAGRVYRVVSTRPEWGDVPRPAISPSP